MKKRPLIINNIDVKETIKEYIFGSLTLLGIFTSVIGFLYLGL